MTKASGKTPDSKPKLGLNVPLPATGRNKRRAAECFLRRPPSVVSRASD